MVSSNYFYLMIIICLHTVIWFQVTNNKPLYTTIDSSQDQIDYETNTSRAQKWFYYPLLKIWTHWWNTMGIVHFKILKQIQTTKADKYCEQCGISEKSLKWKISNVGLHNRSHSVGW